MVIMKCKCCGKEFIRQTNAQKHCSEKCRRKANLPKKILEEQTCQWCGKKFFYVRKKKFCSVECREKSQGKRSRKIETVIPSMTLQQVAKASREAGLSYGQYVMKMGLR